ncbi:MAG: tetratricopeptide repeat protein [Sulfurifustis sp.]
MSLINKMLQDLESRQDVAARAPTPVYQDLRPVRNASRVAASRIAWIAAAAGTLAAAMYFGAQRLPWWPETSSALPASPQPVAVVPADAPPVVAKTPTDAALAIAPPQSTIIPAAGTVNASVPVSVNTKPPAGSHPAASAGIVDKSATPSVAAPGSTRERNRAPAVQASKSKVEPAPAVAESAVMDKKVRPQTAEETAEQGYQRAVRLLDQGRAEEARRAAAEALTAYPGHVKARELAAGIELQNGHWRDAQKLLEEGLRQVANHYLFARMLARVYVDHGAEAKALAVMESASPHASDDADFSGLLGLLYQRAGRPADAVKAYERAAALRPGDARIVLGYAISLESAGQWSAARETYRRARESGELSASLAQYADQRLAALAGR